MAKDTEIRSEKLVSKLERDLAVGVWSPGTWLKQIDIEQRYSASRMIVRRALEVLAARRIIEHIPNRGYHVPAADERSTGEVQYIRALLETATVDDIVRNIDADGLKRLEVHVRAFDELARLGTIAEQDSENQKLHACLLSYCRNRELVTLIRDLRSRTPIRLVNLNYAPAAVQRSSMEHFEMLQALTDRDADRLREITVRHILDHDAASEIGRVIDAVHCFASAS
ncbi:MAG: GntR family transcriptional regulator [Dongiaceae bacterium]